MDARRKSLIAWDENQNVDEGSATKKEGFIKCPRCGVKAFEHLRTYSHCVSCFLIDDHLLDEEEKGIYRSS